MLELFKIEWLKIRRYRTFWLVFLGFLILFPIIYYFIAYKVVGSFASVGTMQEEALKSILKKPFVFPKVWQATAYGGGIFFIAIGMLFVIMITNEVQYRTHRQNIIDGWSRLDFLKAKLSMMIFFIIVSTLLVTIVGLITGISFTPGEYDITEGSRYIGYFAIMATQYMMFAFFVAILVKRTGLAVIIYIAAIVVDNIIWALLFFNDTQLGFFLPLESADSLVGNPAREQILDKRTVSDLALIVACCGYIFGYGYVIVNYFKKTDLKT